MSRWAKVLMLGILTILSQGLLADVPVPRHAYVLEYLTPSPFSTPAERGMLDLARDYACIPGAPTPSTSWYYYTVTAGNPRGTLTMGAKANWVSNSLAWMSGRVTGLSTDFSDYMNWGTAGIESLVETIDDHIQNEVLMPSEMAESFQRAFKAYQLFRQLQVMSRSWTGALFKIDLLDVLPKFEITTLDNFGVPTTNILVSLKYRDSESEGNILSANGLMNPFIGPWSSPKFSYKGPRTLSDIDFNIEATPYSGVVNDDSAVLRAGQSGIELLDRVWYEGVLGGSMAQRGLAYSPDMEEYRNSPKLLKRRAETIAQARLAQIDLEANAKAQATGKPLAEILDSYAYEIDYWMNFGDRVHEGQATRINRYRDELQKTLNQTVQNESVERLKEDSKPAQNTFLESVFDTFHTIGSLGGDLANAVTGNESEGEDTGPRMVFKARVAYAKATHSGYLEAKAIREILYSKLKAAAQVNASDGFIRMQKELKKRLAEQERLEAKLQGYKDSSNQTLELLEDLGLTPEGVNARIEVLRTGGF